MKKGEVYDGIFSGYIMDDRICIMKTVSAGNLFFFLRATTFWRNGTALYPEFFLFCVVFFVFFLMRGRVDKAIVDVLL